MSEPTATSRPARWRTIGIGVVVAIVLFGVIGFFAVPPIAKRAIENAASEQLGRKVTFDALRLNPYTLDAKLTNFAIEDATAGKPLLAFESLEVDVAWSSIAHRGLVIEALKLVRPKAALVRLENGRYNFSDILDKLAAQPKSEGPTPRFSVSNIELVDGRVDVDDRPEKQQHVIEKLEIALPFLSSFPADTKIKVLPKLAAIVNGDPLDAGGDTLPFDDTRATHLAIRFKGFPIGRYLEYSPVELGFKIPSGDASADLALEFAQPKTGAQTLKLRGRVDVTDLALVDRAGAPVAKWKALGVKVREADLTNLDVAVDEVALDAPEIVIRRATDGTLNLAKLGPAAPPKPAAAPAPAANGPSLKLVVDRIAVTDGTIDWADASYRTPVVTKLHPVTITVGGFNLPGEKPATIAVDTLGDLGTTMKHEGSFTLAPFALEGRMELAGVKPRTLNPMLERSIALDVADGTAQASFAYKLSSLDDPPPLVVSDAKIAIENLKLVNRADKSEWLALPNLTASIANLDLAKQSVVVDDLASRGARIAVARAADGSVNWSKVALPAPVEGKPATTKPAPPWSWQVKRLALNDYRVRFADATNGAELPLGPMTVALENLASAKGARANLKFSTGIDKGVLAASGPIVLDPLGLSLALDVKSIDAVRFQPYFADFVNITLASGAVTTRGRLDVESPAGAPLRTRFKGDVTIADLAAADKTTAEDLLKWKSLFLGEVGYDSAPFGLDVRDIALTEFYSRVVVTPQGRLNLQNLVVDRDAAAAPAADEKTPATEKPAPAPAPPADTAAAPRNIRIGKITLQGGNVQFSDFFVKPNFSANLTGIGGGVSEMTPEQAGDVLLRGRVDNSAPIEIAGSLNPLGKSLFLDMKADARDIELSPMTPYSAKYVGYGIEKGKLSVKLAYKIENQKLEAQNNVNLDQLTFGEKIESPDALKLPVLLAVALLKDRNGVIDIDLPISGSLDDPQFSIGGVIVRVIVNLITRAITAPFALLGSLFGGGSEELGFVEYDPGIAALTPQSENKLKTLAKALGDRPALKLDIAGKVEPETDREGLRRARVENAIRAQKFNELAKKGTPAASLDAVAIAPEERRRYLEQAYRAAPFPKPRNALGLVRDLPPEEMEKLLLTNTLVNDDDLRNLANQRAQVAKDYLLGAQIPAERVFVVAPKMVREEANDKGRPTRADFALH